VSALDDFAARLRGLVISVADALSPDEAGLVMHLIDHDEGGEAMLSLAWIAVENERSLSDEAVQSVVRFAIDLGVADDLPASFGSADVG
jgi:hypothetical protein